MTMKKHGHQSIGDFYQQFQAHVHMCEEMDVQLYEPALALSIMSERGGTSVTEGYKQNTHRQAVAMRFIRACGHGEYLQHLRNSFLDGKDIYPKKNSDAFAIMDQQIPTRGAPHTSITTNNKHKLILLKGMGEGHNKYDNPAQGTEASSGVCISARKASLSTDLTNNSIRDRVSCDIHTEPTPSHNSN